MHYQREGPYLLHILKCTANACKALLGPKSQSLKQVDLQCTTPYPPPLGVYWAEAD